jgi:hypothetical protein
VYVIKVAENVFSLDSELKVVMVTQDYAKAKAYFDSLKYNRNNSFSYIFIGKNDE